MFRSKPQEPVDFSKRVEDALMARLGDDRIREIIERVVDKLYLKHQDEIEAAVEKKFSDFLKTL